MPFDVHVPLFSWESFTTLDFEWSIIRGRRPYRWTIWNYSLTRISTLVHVILGLIARDQNGCQILIILEFVSNDCVATCHF
ncbi:hypothetical protein BGW80DRAFT_1384566 [Lactifluus volemus]|nr:hypothetical protein BGW80DRAFT_1384566 [Lactifluus volemus]